MSCVAKIARPPRRCSAPLLRAAEPVYSGIMAARNRVFDAGIGVKRLPRPVVSIGNVTAGGTGKTPVVRWLCEQLRSLGHNPAVLLRGYKSVDGVSDEQRLLHSLLNPPGGAPVIVRANPDRFAGGSDVLRERPGTDVFVLDDGFQHRRLARDFDLVLINAAEPFGFGHVHPRGLLRESLRGLGRADAVLITLADAVAALALEAIESRVRQFHADIPIYHASHVLCGFRREDQTLAPKRCVGGGFICSAGSVIRAAFCSKSSNSAHRWPRFDRSRITWRTRLKRSMHSTRPRSARGRT